ncbi:putative glutamine amidotransferase domain containing protein ChyE [Septoria linicola]|nr:putative glutamine amidotransferase domain containing protein ChyE [Septoria linicola]
MISMARETVKMLVLETDETHPKTMKESGDFGQIINRFFTEAGENHDPPLGIETDMHFVVEAPENGHEGHVPKASEIPEDVHAILITGSMYDAHSDEGWVQKLRDLVTELWQTRPDMKFAGICFGHQLLARTLGAEVESTPGEKWELAHTEMDLTYVGQKLFRTEDKTLDVHQMHQDQVTTVPSSKTTALLRPDQNVHVWASTEHTKIQGLYIRDRLFSSQGHLGFDETMVKRQVELRIKSGAIKEKDREEVEYANETAHLEHDGEVVAAAILRFFHGDDHDVD